MNLKLFAYIQFYTLPSHTSKLYPLQVVEDYEKSTGEEISIEEVLEVLFSLYRNSVDLNAEIFFCAQFIE